MTDNDWNHTEPEASSADLLSHCFNNLCGGFLFFFKRIFVCHTNAKHSTRVERCREGFLLPVRQDTTQWFLRGWTNTVASSNTLRTVAGEARANNPESSDVCQYDVVHKRVMFSSVKAAICVWDVGVNSASNSLSGFPSIFQVLSLLVSRFGALGLMGSSKSIVWNFYFYYMLHHQYSTPLIHASIFWPVSLLLH